MKSCILFFSIALMGVMQWGFVPAHDPVTVYVFMGEKCVICRHYTLQLKALDAQYKEQGIRFVGVFSNGYSTEAGMAAFREKYGLEFEFVLDEEQKLMQELGAKITPEVYVYHHATDQVLYQGRIDDQYVRVGRRRPAPTTAELADVLSALAQGKTVETASAPAVGCFITQMAVCK